MRDGKRLISGSLSVVAILSLHACGEDDGNQNGTPADEEIHGTVIFSDQTPAVWSTRLGLPTSAKVCVKYTYCVLLTGDTCEKEHTVRQCVYAQQDGSYQLANVPAWWYHRSERGETLALEVREDISQAIETVVPGMEYHFTLPFTQEGLRQCQPRKQNSFPKRSRWKSKWRGLNKSGLAGSNLWRNG